VAVPLDAPAVPDPKSREADVQSLLELPDVDWDPSALFPRGRHLLLRPGIGSRTRHDHDGRRRDRHVPPDGLRHRLIGLPCDEPERPQTLCPK
jgi:hypothetical protein